MKTIALVGCGRISNRHIDAIAENPELKIQVVCDIQEDRARNTAERLNCEWVTDYKKLPAVDAVSVLTPSGLHPVHAAEIAECTDIPNIIVEKPVSLTVREAYELFKRVEQAGKRLLPVFQNRYNPLVAFIQEQIAKGTFGTIHQYTCNVFWNRNDEYYSIDWHGTNELDGGVLYTQASHYVDMLSFFFGPIRNFHGYGGNLRKLETFDSISIVTEFENGTVGTMNATVSTYEKNYLTEFTVIGSKGTVRLSGTNLNTIDFWNVAGMEKPDMDFTIDHVYGKGHDTMYKYFLEERWEMFPVKDDVLAGIRLMEKLSY